MTREALEIANELNHKIVLCTSALERPVTGIRYEGGGINLPKEVNEDIQHVIEKWSEKYQEQFAKL